MELTRLIQLAKLMVLHHQILFSLVTAATAEAILMQTSTEQVPSLHRAAPRRLKLATSSLVIDANICTDVHAIVQDLALFCADFHSTCRCSVYVGEVLKFITYATHKIHFISKPQVAYGPSTNGDGCVVVMECFLHNFLYEQVEQDE